MSVLLRPVNLPRELTRPGALTACALCINGWSVEKCVESFEVSSQLAFEQRRPYQLFSLLFGDIPIISPLVRFGISLVLNSKHSAKKLEVAQQEVFGRHRSIVCSDEASEMGVLLGVTLTSTDDASTFVVTNYNGVGEPRDHTSTHTPSPSLARYSRTDAVARL